MKKLLISTVTMSILCFLLLTPVSAGTDVQYTATVTAETVSISFSPASVTSVDYGVLSFGDVEAPPINAGGDPTLSVKNTGTVVEDFGIRGDDATATEGSTWELSSGPGEDKYVHKYSSGSTWVPLAKEVGNNYITQSGIDPEKTTTFRLRLSMPTSATTYTSNEYTTTVTVVATAH